LCAKREKRKRKGEEMRNRRPGKEIMTYTKVYS